MVFFLIIIIFAENYFRKLGNDCPPINKFIHRHSSLNLKLDGHTTLDFLFFTFDISTSFN